MSFARSLAQLGEVEEFPCPPPEGVAIDVEVSTEHLQIQPYRQLELEGVLLGHDAQALADLGAVLSWVEAENGERSRARLGDG